LLVATACAGDSAVPVATSEPTVDTSDVSAVTVATVQVGSSVVESSLDGPTSESVTVAADETASDLVAGTSRPLSELSAELSDAVSSVEHRVGVAVLDLEQRVTYQGGDTDVFALASISKLALTIGMLRRAELEDRDLTWPERTQLSLMLSESKNGPAVALWNELGASGVGSALAAYGIEGFWMPPDEQWGDMAASAEDVATVMQLFVAEGSPLRQEDREQVLSLLQSVVAGQRWGVSAGIDFSDGVGAVLAIKNGWYPEDEIWRVNSAGAVTVTGQTRYVVVVLSDGATNFSRAVRTVEEISAAVNGALYSEELLVELPAFVLVPDQLSATLPAEDGVATAGEPADELAAEEIPPVELVVLASHADVLVPSIALLGSETREDSFAIWFEVPEDEVEALLDAYLGSMRGLGWAALSGPPQLLLSKNEGRFVAVTPLPGAAGGTQIVEFRIAPALAPMVGAAAVE
jgi:Beta-lactamase enzyme family